MSKFDPPFTPLSPDVAPDADAFNALGLSVNKLHDCLNAGFEAADKNVTKVKVALDRQTKINGAFRAKSLAHQAKVAAALSLDKPRAQPIALWTPMKVLRWAGVWGATAFFAAKVGNAVWPYVTGMAVALWHLALK